MEIVVVAVPGFLVGCLLGIITRNIGMLGLLFCVFLLAIIGHGNFSGDRFVFWSLAGSILTHTTPTHILQAGIDWLWSCYSNRKNKKWKSQKVTKCKDSKTISPEDFWDSIESLNDTTKDTPENTEPMSDEFWDAVYDSKNETRSDESK